MAKSARGRRRAAIRHHRTARYPLHTYHLHRHVTANLTGKPPSIKDWEDITCSVCMEYPHNAVLLLCSSHDKGCRPYMCGTSSRYSNCLDQYKAAASTKSAPPLLDQDSLVQDTSLHFSTSLVEKCRDGAELACPLCRGQVKGWTVIESAREYLNLKKRNCMHDECAFVGVYKELKKHVRAVHPSAKPREVDPDQEQKWRRLEREREREDVISTVTSSIPGSVVFGDYVIERNQYGFDSEDEDGLGNVGTNGNLMNVLFLLHAFGPSGNMGRHHHHHHGDNHDDDHDHDDDGDHHHDGVGLAARMRRQGRVILGRSGRRRRNSER